MLSQKLWFGDDLGTNLSKLPAIVLVDEIAHQWNFYGTQLPNFLAEGVSQFTDTMFVEFMQGQEDSKSFLQYARSSTSTINGRLFFVFAIRLKETGRAIGSIDFKNPNPRCGQIDYALGYNYWNKGFVSEAAEKIRDWSFEALPEMVRFQAFCAAENKGSRRVMEKIGVQHEGLRRKSFYLKGQMVDLGCFSTPLPLVCERRSQNHCLLCSPQ